MPEKNSVPSDGSCIVMLTDAEKKARTVIEAAKKRKAFLMKKAKEESADEIESFRKEREQAVDRLKKEYSNGQEQDFFHLEETLGKKKAIMQEEFKFNFATSLELILETVINVEPIAHGNLII